MGAVATAYTPTSQSDWAPQTIGIPKAARTDYTIFRFRYHPNTSPPNVIPTTGYDYTYSTGNNFFMDRINFSRIPAAVSNIVLNNTDVILVPNPTSGDAYVVIKDLYNSNAQIMVTDITGNVVYKTQQELNNGEARISIPRAAISVKGIYIVETVTGGQAHTQKLVVD